MLGTSEVLANHKERSIVCNGGLQWRLHLSLRLHLRMRPLSHISGDLLLSAHKLVGFPYLSKGPGLPLRKNATKPWLKLTEEPCR
jgi:hypothetical protein